MRYPWWRLSVFVAAASVPAYWLYQASAFALGPDPGKVLVDNLGQGALTLLLCSLAMSPLQQLSGWSGWIAVRRQLGLWTFFYATLHLLGYCYFILGFDLGEIPKELLERPYIAVGALGYLALLVLAATSTHWSMRRLGKRWKQLHRQVYFITLIVLIHMLWVVRADLREWGLYAVIGGGLLLARTPWVQRRMVAKFAGRRRDMKKTKTTG